MLVAALTCILGLAVVLLVVYVDGPLDTPAPQLPDWDLLPTPADVARSDFPLAFPGYDPATVETHLDLLRSAYTDLFVVAPPEVLRRARHRAALRAGVDPAHLDEPPPARGLMYPSSTLQEGSAGFDGPRPNQGHSGYEDPADDDGADGGAHEQPWPDGDPLDDDGLYEEPVDFESALTSHDQRRRSSRRDHE